MCIIIDTNCLSEVFDSSNVNHKEFKPVLDWVWKGKGKIVYGGSRYIEEIGNKYLQLFLIFKKAGKGVYINNKTVDKEETRISQIIQHKDFNDQHIIALLRISKCQIICSNDKRAYPFFRHKKFFNPSNTKPKIYSSSKNKILLNDSNIADICKPAHKTTNKQRSEISKFY